MRRETLAHELQVGMWIYIGGAVSAPAKVLEVTSPTNPIAEHFGGQTVIVEWYSLSLRQKTTDVFTVWPDSPLWEETDPRVIEVWKEAARFHTAESRTQP